jgi:hypothetical protein
MQGKKDEIIPVHPLMSILNVSLFFFYKPSNIFHNIAI